MHFRKVIPAFFMVSALYLVPGHAQADALQDWMMLRDSRNNIGFPTYARFLNTHPDWPQAKNAIALNAETALLRDGADNGTIADWFTIHPPMTDEGRLRFVMAQHNLGRSLQAQQLAREYWHSGFFDSARQARLLTMPGIRLSSADHAARMDMLLWQGNRDRAETLLTSVDATTRQAAKARIALQRNNTKIAPSLVQSVSSQQRNSNGLLFDRVQYARRRSDDTFAAQLISYASGHYGHHGAAWGREKLLLARRALEQGNPTRAFALTQNNTDIPAAERAELQWFGGWVALTRLHKPQAAQQSFESMYGYVVAPISRTRAAYWAGSAADEAGDKPRAIRWYQTAAQHPHLFYGLMSAYALNQAKPAMAQFTSRNVPLHNLSVSALPGDMVDAARQLHRMGKTAERDLFLQAMINVTEKSDNAQHVIPLARELNSTKMALVAAKAAYAKGVLVIDALFPRLPFPPQEGVDPALTLAIARQESLFDPTAISSAGARGLLQLMPATAAHVARRYDVSYNGTDSLYYPRTNLQLGQCYLRDLLNRYNAFAPLAIGAYNAGPGNVDKFINMNGDPRRKGADWTDWVERIPFYETRNYVQRVWESYVVYGYILER